MEDEEMRLYFSTGKKRLAIDTERHTWNNHYCYLGAHRHYIKISAADYKELLLEVDFNCYDYDEKFLEVSR